MTWHAKALQTSYISMPAAGSCGADYGEARFPNSATACFFLDALDMEVSAEVPVIVCFGDSITDGTGSTLNGDDRWPDALRRRLNSIYPNRVAVVNAGIGGNRVVGPISYDIANPTRGGPAAVQRIARDVANLSGVSTVVWLEGINDLPPPANASVEEVIAGFEVGVAAMRGALPDVRIFGATIVTALGADGDYGGAEVDAKRRAINAYIRSNRIFDGVLDFDRVVLDCVTGGLQPQFTPSSTLGGAGDRVHPNRAGYLAIAESVDLTTIVPRSRVLIEL